MLIDTSQIEAVLMNKAVSAYRLAKEIGIQESSISLLRNGKKDFNKLSLEVAMRVQSWIDAGNYQILQKKFWLLRFWQKWKQTMNCKKTVIFHGFYLAPSTSLYILCPFSSSSCLSSLLSRSMRAFLFARWALWRELVKFLMKSVLMIALPWDCWTFFLCRFFLSCILCETAWANWLFWLLSSSGNIFW